MGETGLKRVLNQYIQADLKDITALLKWHFFEIKPVNFAIEPFITFPVGTTDKGLGTGRTNPGFIFITTSDIKPFLTHTNIDYLRNENTVGLRTDLWHFSIAAEWILRTTSD